eukprot:s2480_g10.t1
MLNPERDMAREHVAQNTPVPNVSEDDDLICEGLHCTDVDPESFSLEPGQGWLCEVYVTDHDIEQWKHEDNPYECVFLASAAKRQKSEVKLTSLGPNEKAEFQKAKELEIQNWLKTGTISRILRDKVPPDQILRCRWILTWKPIDEQEREQLKGTKNHKAKARLVILGYLDPKITEVPRDSPTLGRHSKMLLLQLIASKGWSLKSFDVKTAFLQGKNQKDRTLAIEPVAEIIQMMKLSPQEVCKLEKGAYGLVDAPYMWFQAILEELLKLQFEQSPFDPCLFILRNPDTLEPDGVLGLHVDDGLCAGNSRFLDKLEQLEKKYPFGSKRTGQFTFTGIDMMQTPEGTIHLSQSKYIRAIDPIKISTERRKQIDQPVTEDERQQLRALIGSLQYAAVHTRPDLSSRLSMLQSSINIATVDTLTTANQALHEAKKHHDVTIKVWPLASTLLCGEYLIQRCRDLNVSVVLYDPTTPHGLLVAQKLNLPKASLVTFPGMGSLADLMKEDWLLRAAKIRAPYGRQVPGYGYGWLVGQWFAPMNFITTCDALVAPIPDAPWATELSQRFRFEPVGCLVSPLAPHVAQARAQACAAKASKVPKALKDGLPLEELNQERAAGHKIIFAALGTMALSDLWSIDLGRVSGGNLPPGTTGKEYCQHVWRALLEAMEQLGEEYYCVLCAGKQRPGD